MREPENPLMRDVRQQGTLRVIATLNIREPADANSEEAQRRYRRAIARTQDRVVADLEPYDVRVLARYKNFRMIALRVDEGGLRHLLSSSLVTDVDKDKLSRRST